MRRGSSRGPAGPEDGAAATRGTGKGGGPACGPAGAAAALLVPLVALFVFGDRLRHGSLRSTTPRPLPVVRAAPSPVEAQAAAHAAARAADVREGERVAEAAWREVVVPTPDPATLPARSERQHAAAPPPAPAPPQPAQPAPAAASTQTIAELINGAQMSRQQAQKVALHVLKGRLVGTKLKAPEPSFNWTSEPRKDPECKQELKARRSIVSQNFIYHNSQHGPWRYGHMVMLSRMPSRALWRFVVAWQASGGLEGAPGQEIVLSFGDDPMKSDWTPPLVAPLTQSNRLPVWGPVLHYDETTDELWLFYSHSTSCAKGDPRHRRYAPGGDIQYVRSVDGLTWTAPKTIVTQAWDGGIPKVLANQLIVHRQTGDWILPFWREQPHSSACRPRADRSKPTSAGVLMSPDSGRTWKSVTWYRARGTRWLIEATVAELSNGHVLMLHRSGESTLYQQVSKNGGNSWSQPAKTSIPNPNSKVDMVRVEPSGVLALAFNDVKGGTRRHMKVALSGDDGKSWTRFVELENGGNGLHFAYPTLIQDGCRLLVAYSVTRHSNRRDISATGIKLAVVQLPADAHKAVDQGEKEDMGGVGPEDAEGSNDAADSDPVAVSVGP